MRRILIFGAAAVLLHAQPVTLSGPVSGFVFDPVARALRPVVGIPGASALGPSVDLKLDLDSAVLSPRQDTAIATAADGSLHFYRIAGARFTEQQAPAFSGPPRSIVFSPSGTAVALIFAGTAEIVTGFPDAPAIAGSVELAANPQAIPSRAHPARVPAIAVSDDGSSVVEATGQGLLLLGTAGRRTLGDGTVSTVAFRPGSRDLAIVAGASVILIADVAGSADRRVLAKDGFGSAGGAAFSEDGATLYVANRDEQSVASFDLSSGDRTDLACACKPATLTRMGPLFRLDAPAADGPLWFLEPAPGEPRIVFVPAAQ